MLEQTLLGTYTRETSQGTYKIVLDTTQGRLTEATPLLEETSPTYLALNQKGELFNVTSVDGEGGTAAYQPEMNHFNLLNKITEESASSYYAAVDKNQQLVYATNCHQGTVHMCRTSEGGSLEGAGKVVHTEPTGPHENQNNAHVHYTDLTPDQCLVVCDLGTDHVYTYNVNLNGKLSETAQFVAGPGTGPRYLVFHPTKSLVYLLGELDSTASVLPYDETNDSFIELQKVSTLPTGYDVLNGRAVVHTSSDGRLLYASNRGHNSTAIYAVSENGETIERIQLISAEGNISRDFDLGPSEDFIVVTNRGSDSLALYRRNQEIGLLEMI